MPGGRATLFWCALLAVVFGGRLYSTDVAAQLEVAGSILGQRPLFTAANGWVVEGLGGNGYVPHAPGYSLILLPAAAAGLLTDLAAKPVAAAICALTSAALVAAWSGLCGRCNGSPPGAARMILLALCGMALVYGRMPFDVTAAAFFCVAAMNESMDGRHSNAGAALGAAMLVRLDSVVFLPSLVRGRRSLAGLAPGIAAALALLGAYNLFRFGSPLEDGHSMDPAMAFSPGLAGLAGLLFSPGKGLLWYAPAAFIALGRARDWRLVAPFVISLVLHSQIRDWTGGTGWGPRFLFTALPPLLAPLAAPGRAGPLLLAAGAWAVACSSAAVWSDPAAVEQSLGADAFDDPSRQAVIWKPSRSPLAVSLARIGRGAPDLFPFTAAEVSPAAGAAAGAVQAAAAAVFAAAALSRSRRILS
ncbi:hypothetical protein GX411_02805 [Candidatus Fermentibacteria bacterium]|nr:hypothetical protein [Candidatus Fermentibacteria bacterium]